MNRTGSGGQRLLAARPSGAESVDQVRRQVDRLCWTGILLGLAFTMTNVQGFAAAGARVWSLTWLAAWLLAPMVSLVLLAILRAEQITAQHGVPTGGWVRGAKWFTLGATYVMNTWAAYAAGSPALVVLHSVPPLVVFMAAEAVTVLRDKLADAVTAQHTAHVADNTYPANATPETPDGRPVRQARARRRTATGTPRVSFGQYLDRARTVYQPGVTVTPAWVREVTGCSRGLSSRLATTLTAELAGEEAQS
jgi:signal transduction histidine kinase